MLYIVLEFQVDRACFQRRSERTIWWKSRPYNKKKEKKRIEHR